MKHLLDVFFWVSCVQRIFNLIGKKEKNETKQKPSRKQAAAHNVRVGYLLFFICSHTCFVSLFMLPFENEFKCCAERFTEYCTLRLNRREKFNLNLLQSKICQEYIESLKLCVCVLCIYRIVRMCSHIQTHPSFSGFFIVYFDFTSFLSRFSVWFCGWAQACARWYTYRMSLSVYTQTYNSLAMDLLFKSIDQFGFSCVCVWCATKCYLKHYQQTC